MIFIFAILSFVASIVFNVIWTHKKFLSEKYINHSKDWKVKAISCIPCTVLFYLYLDNVFWPIRAGVSLLMVMAFFWLFFDGFIGLRVNKGFFWIGEEGGKSDAKTDNILQGIPIVVSAAIKIALCIVTSFVYYKLSLN